MTATLLATKRVEDTSEFGVVITGDDGRIQGFQEKPDPAEALSNLANCGIYMFRREIFDHFPGPDHTSPAGDPDQPAGFVDWAMDVFPALLEHDIPFYSHEIDAYWNDIGNVAELVSENPAAFERHDEKTTPDGVKRFAAAHADGLAVIGGSALSPPELPLDKPLPVKPGAAYADVGFRLAFTAPARSLAERLEWVLGDQDYVWPSPPTAPRASAAR